MNLKFLCGLVALAFAGSALATAPLQVNDTPNYFTVPGGPPPVYDVTAFQNNSIFSVSYSVYTPYPELYETMNTLFYTNNDTMIANSPISTNGFLSSFGCGYRFDHQTTNVISHGPADTFYNPGTIRCNSTNDGNNLFGFGGFNFFFLESLGECLVTATNIQNSGEIIVGPEGLIQLNGSNVDLSYGTLSIEQPLSAASLIGNSFNLGQTLPGVTASGATGTDTNADWVPSASLTPTTATNSEPFQYQFALTNSQAYFHFDQLDSTDVVVRAVFVQDTSVDVSYLVYFGQNIVGSGSATVEWMGAHQDPASGQIQGSYLYLNDDYLLGASTNVLIINGVPDNFTLLESPTQIALTGQTPGGFPAGFAFTPTGGITNPYSYLNAQFLSSTVPTNSSGFNPSGALTNLPGRIFVTANSDFNLANAQISGQNYMSLYAPHQFDGSPGAHIVSPYSDINVGVTNGFLTVSNLIAAGVPTFSGNLVAWSTRWTNTDINGINYDYRVMMVGSSFAPVSQSWIQGLTLHGTNSLVISDVMNVFKSINIDAQNLTLTTNVYGNGATSPDGELNWDNLITFGPTQIPNVLWLTNNGAIRAGGIDIFGTSTVKYGAFINTGLIEDQGTTIWTTNFVNDGVISNGLGSFALQAQSVTMTNSATLTNGANSSVTAQSDLIIAANTFVVSNEVLSAGRMLQLTVTNVLTDLGGTNGSFWSVGSAAISGFDSGFNLPIKPLVGDLLGTTVTNIAPAGKNINNLWAALDRGYSNTGYYNNVAVGQLVLSVGGPSARLNFNGTGTNGMTNAIYVDCLQLHGYAAYYPTNRIGTTLTALNFNTNLVIYYAQALNDTGVSVAEAINHFNGDHLRWVPTYAGTFSGTNLVYPNGTTNFVNAALAASPDIDSNGNGSPNDQDPAPIFVPSELNFTISVTNLPPKSVKLTWTTVANGTNYIYYKTNLLSPSWLPFNGFKNFYYDPGQSGTNAAHTNWFISPFQNPSNPTNVWIYDTLTNMPHFYQIVVVPWLTGN